MPQEGERVVTSAEAGAFPANLPVGTVHYSAANVPEVVPAAMLDRLEMVRIFDYGLARRGRAGGAAARLPGAARPLMARRGPDPRHPAARHAGPAAGYRGAPRLPGGLHDRC